MTWVYLSLNSTRGAQFASPTLLFFHVILLSVYFCDANAGYTHVTESWSCPGAQKSRRRFVPSSCSVTESQKEAAQVPKVAVKNHVQPGCTLVPQLGATIDGSLSASSSISSAVSLYAKGDPQSPFTAPAPEDFCISAVALPDLQLSPLSWSSKLVQPGLIPVFAPFSRSENFHLKKEKIQLRASCKNIPPDMCKGISAFPSL